MSHEEEMNIDHLLTRAILEAQARHENAKDAAVDAANAYVAGRAIIRDSKKVVGGTRALDSFKSTLSFAP